MGARTKQTTFNTDLKTFQLLQELASLSGMSVSHYIHGMLIENFRELRASGRLEEIRKGKKND